MLNINQDSIMRYFFLVLSLLFFTNRSLSAQSFTLDEILSAPYVNDLTSSPHEDRIAFEVNERGVRNIWTATPSFGRTRQLTNYQEDDGRELSQIHFAPDRKTLYYVRNGSVSRKGDFPNPDSDPDGAYQRIFRINFQNLGEPKLITYGNHPQVSPDGRRLMFNRRGVIHVIELSEKMDKPNIFFNVRGSVSKASWSKDSRKVLFQSNRGTHSFVGIYHIIEDKIEWLSPSVDFDTHPIWSPDNKKVAFIRSPSRKKDELRNIMSNNAFSIWVFDTETKESIAVWTSPNDLGGGFAQYYPSHPLRWASDERLLFYSEHRDWMHIYALDWESGKLTDLTPGDCEVEHSALSSDGEFLVYSSNCKNLNSRQLWKINTDGTRDSRLVAQEGVVQTDPVISSKGSWVIFRKSDAYTPTGIGAVKSTGKSYRQVHPDKLGRTFPDEKDLVQAYNEVVYAADGQKIHVQIFEPKDIKVVDKRPAIIFMHGGPMRQMLPAWHYRGYYANSYAMNQYLCSKGYIVLSVNYRAGIGYGRDFRLAPNQGPRGASEYQDIVAAGKYLASRVDVDPQKIGLWGGSYGGYLTAMGLARNPELFAAGVDIHGVHDWAWRGRDFVPGGAWGITEDLMDLAYQSSPVADLSKWKAPVLLIHGDDDRNVMFEQTIDLAQRLREKNVPTELLVLPDEVHGFLRYTSWLQVFQATDDFFERNLK